MFVLYADDDPDDIEVFVDAVREISNDIEVAVAKNGRQALEILEGSEKLPSLIFLDINMPYLSGRDCLIALKASEKFKNIPVIMYSTTGNQNELNNFILLGAKDYIVKGVSFQGIKEALSRVLN